VASNNQLGFLGAGLTEAVGVRGRNQLEEAITRCLKDGRVSRINLVLSEGITSIPGFISLPGTFGHIAEATEKRAASEIVVEGAIGSGGPLDLAAPEASLRIKLAGVAKLTLERLNLSEDRSVGTVIVVLSV
jgi:hypothetical protein